MNRCVLKLRPIHPTQKSDDKIAHATGGDHWDGKSDGRGHIGITELNRGDFIQTIEGNMCMRTSSYQD